MPQLSLRVLVVDDDEEDFLILRDLLGDVVGTDYRVDWADSLSTGLDALRSGGFDICLVDQLLGAERGIDLIRAAVLEVPATPTILLTGATSRELDEAALAAGAWDYLVKGAFDAELLSRSIRYVLEGARALQRLEAAHAQQQRLLEDAVDAILVVDDHGLVEFANPAAETLFGQTRDQLRGERLPQAQALMRSHGSEVEIQCNGGTRLVEPRVTATQWHGAPAKLLLLRDQTELQRHRQQLALLERAIESTLNGVVICDARSADMPLIYANRAFEQITGYRVAEAVGRNMRFLQGEDRDQPGIASLRAALAAREPCDVVLRNYRKDGEAFWNQLSISPVRDLLGEVTHFIGIQNDLTDRIAAEEALAHAESHDAVTGLVRYPLFATRMATALAKKGTEASGLSVLFIGLDRFQTVNESLGHSAGDFALQEVAARIQVLCPDSAADVARYAGDEFIAVIRDKGEDEAMALAEAIGAAICEPIEGDGFRLFLTASIGLSRFPEHGVNWTDLLRRAELAMSQAKQRGRDQVVPFSMEQMLEMEARLELGRHLRDAFRADEFRLNFQPIFGLQPHRLCGFEALLRWHNAALGEVSPARFIPVAESLGLMPELGRWVLRESCRQIRAWLDAGRAGFTLSVNVSALQLLRPDFISDLAGMIQEFRIPTGVLDIELTESVLMAHVEQTRDTLFALKRLGVSISLDDFGTGYSSLAYLRDLPLDKLKIDRSFIRDLPGNAGAVAIARTIVGIAHELQLKVCAEGVETEEQRAFLAQCDCDLAQGYLLGRPVPPEQIVESAWPVRTAGA